MAKNYVLRSFPDKVRDGYWNLGVDQRHLFKDLGTARPKLSTRVIHSRKRLGGWKMPKWLYRLHLLFEMVNLCFIAGKLVNG